jgi:uncharacterized damage-inducible protein DinB
MSKAQAMLEQFKQEAAGTRKMLERVPFDRAEWAPHEKSMTLGRLAGHIAEMHQWGASILTSDEFDMAPPDGEPYKSPVLESSEDLLDEFDRGVSAVEAALPGVSDEAWAEHWSLKSGGNEVFGGPRGESFGMLTMNHVIHHRGQLSVYLRLCDVPVPGMYGPSADDKSEAPS